MKYGAGNACMYEVYKCLHEMLQGLSLFEATKSAGSCRRHKKTPLTKTAFMPQGFCLFYTTVPLKFFYMLLSPFFKPQHAGR
ncbi:MAG TPA: hypothetical protein PKC39_00115 [Ferruginibacter sp.]|nr:hypothetical protein [Ferruginibacter sp.]HMP19333.1 hypothetical protein [Ferruginibacter sp.]